jgi:hypothetical protein
MAAAGNTTKMKDADMIQEYEKDPQNMSKFPKEMIIIVSDAALLIPTG